MTAIRFLLLGCAAAALGAQPPAASSPQSGEVLAGTVDGVPVTMSELQLVLAGSPRELQSTLQNNTEELLRYYGFMRKLAAEAEAAQLHEKSPYQDRIRLMRQSILAEARLDLAYQENPVTIADETAFYEANKNSFAWAKTKVIYIPFSEDPPARQPKGARPVLSEAQAKAKADKVAAAARAGQDFVALVKQHSEHADSASKDGDFGVIQASDKYPDEVKQALFKASKGEIAGPVRLSNGFYIFRIEDAGVKPFSEVRSEIFNELKERRWREWMEKTRRGVQVTVAK